MKDDKKESLDRFRTDEAWKRLARRLENETPHPRWNMWENNRSAARPNPEISPFEQEKPQPAFTAAEGNRQNESESTGKGPSESLPSRWFHWSKKRIKRLGAVAAAVLAAALLFSPKGNDVLAALLNQFRMEQVTVVQEEELRKLFEQVFDKGINEEAVSRFGQFRHVSGSIEGPMSLEAAERELGRDLAVLPGFDAESEQVYVSPSHAFELKMNVDEVNAVMKRLGAETLLPEEVDGNTISLQLGESVSMHVDNGKGDYRYLYQMPVPTIAVSEGVPLEKALQAVIQFPLLPESLKKSLTQASVLERGTVPLPLVVEENTEKVDVNGTEVLVTNHPFDGGAHYEATWVKDGFLYQLGGSSYTDIENLKTSVAELIRS